MIFDELTINGSNKDDNHSASTTTAANPEIETSFSETAHLLLHHLPIIHLHAV